MINYSLLNSRKPLHVSRMVHRQDRCTDQNSGLHSSRQMFPTSLGNQTFHLTHLI